MTSYTQYRDPSDTTSGFSPAIWADCPTAEIAHGGLGYDFLDDFLDGQITGTITTAAAQATIGRGYNVFGSTGSTHTFTNQAGGEFALAETTDNESASMNTEQHPFSITANAGKLWFEARIKLALTAASENAWYCGFMDGATLLVGLPLATTGLPIATQNFVGFHGPDANSTAFDFIHQSNGNSLVEMSSDIGVLANDTYVKVGFVFDPTPSTTGTANQIVGYVNGAKQADGTNHPFTVPDNTGTAFPADVRFGLCLALIVGATAGDNILTIDWWRAAQLRT